MITDTDRSSLLLELNRALGLNYGSFVLLMGKGTPFWDALDAAWPYWQAGCRPTSTTNVGWGKAALAMAIDEMNDAGDHAAYEVRTHALHPGTRFLASLLLHPNADRVEFPWCAGVVASPIDAFSAVYKDIYNQAIADVAAAIGRMKK